MTVKWALIEPTGADTGVIRKIFPSEQAGRDWIAEHHDDPEIQGWWLHPCDDLEKPS